MNQSQCKSCLYSTLDQQTSHVIFIQLQYHGISWSPYLMVSVFALVLLGSRTQVRTCSSHNLHAPCAEPKRVVSSNPVPPPERSQWKAMISSEVRRMMQNFGSQHRLIVSEGAWYTSLSGKKHDSHGSKLHVPSKETCYILKYV